jgi:hypothetical protein
MSDAARARLRFWAKFLLFLSLVAAAAYAIDRYRQSQPAAILPSPPHPLAKVISSSSSAAAANSKPTVPHRSPHPWSPTSASPG